MKKKIIPIILFLFSINSSFAQSSIDSTVVAYQSQALDTYYKYLNENLGLYNGREYVDYDRNIDGHPFFKSEQFKDGSIIYDETVYKNIPILYDIVKEKLILLHFSKSFKVELQQEKVERFTYGEDTFKRITREESQTSSIESGYYQLLHQGTFEVLVKRKKILREAVTSRGVEAEFNDKNYYYIRKDKRFFLINSKKDVLKLMPDKKQEIVKMLRKRKIKFRQNPDLAITQMVKWYESI